MKYIEAKIPVIYFQDDDKIIAYSPALDLSTFGDTEKEAKKRFGETIGIFIKECQEMGTLDDVLEECGWNKDKERLCWLPPVYRSYGEEIVRIPQTV